MNVRIFDSVYRKILCKKRHWYSPNTQVCMTFGRRGVFGSTKDRVGLWAVHSFLPWPDCVILGKSLHVSGPRTHFLMCKTVEVLWKPTGKRDMEDLWNTLEWFLRKGIVGEAYTLWSFLNSVSPPSGNVVRLRFLLQLDMAMRFSLANEVSVKAMCVNFSSQWEPASWSLVTVFHSCLSMLGELLVEVKFPISLSSRVPAVILFLGDVASKIHIFSVCQATECWGCLLLHNLFYLDWYT